MSAGSPVPPADRAALFGLISQLLTYPDADLLAARTEIASAASEIADAPARALVERFLAWFTATPATEIQQHYVHTFDLRRRSSLNLTYYLHGDTRKRGIALLALKQRYRAKGLRQRRGELPDLLPVILEFAAVAGPGEGEAPLRQHRRGIGLLHSALDEAGTPYRHLLGAVSRALPDLTRADHEAIDALAVDGPPTEFVGLGPDLGLTPGSPAAGPTGELAPYGSCPHSEVRV